MTIEEETEIPEPQTKKNKTPQADENNVLNAIRKYFTIKDEKNVKLDIKRITAVNFRLNWYGITKSENDIVENNKIIRSKFIKVINTGTGFDFVDQTKHETMTMKERLEQ